MKRKEVIRWLSLLERKLQRRERSFLTQGHDSRCAGVALGTKWAIEDLRAAANRLGILDL
jgi:hypothetical protein